MYESPKRSIACPKLKKGAEKNIKRTDRGLSYKVGPKVVRDRVLRYIGSRRVKLDSPIETSKVHDGPSGSVIARPRKEPRRKSIRRHSQVLKGRRIGVKNVKVGPCVNVDIPCKRIHNGLDTLSTLLDRTGVNRVGVPGIVRNPVRRETKRLVRPPLDDDDGLVIRCSDGVDKVHGRHLGECLPGRGGSLPGDGEVKGVDLAIDGLCRAVLDEFTADHVGFWSCSGESELFDGRGGDGGGELGVSGGEEGEEKEECGCD